MTRAGLKMLRAAIAETQRRRNWHRINECIVCIAAVAINSALLAYSYILWVTQ